jgi:hypothetical protein
MNEGRIARDDLMSMDVRRTAIDDFRLCLLFVVLVRFIYSVDGRRTNSEGRFKVYGRKTNFEGRYFIDEINLFNIIVILSDLLEIIS